ncbi:MAG TPA: MXAN_5187 family protein [Nannocystis sp.]
MLLTKIWAAILACLATAFLAGMFLLSFGTAGGFTDADRAALKAKTEAGVVALEAAIQASPVARAPAILSDPYLKLALNPTAPGLGKVTPPSLADAFATAANSAVLSDNTQMTVGLFDKSGALLVYAGGGHDELVEAAQLPNFVTAPADREDQFSATLRGVLHVVRVSKSDEAGRRLIAIHPLDLGANSIFRRILGTQNPAALVRNGQVLENTLINPGNSGDALQKFAAEHGKDAPGVGASDAFKVGEGLNARIGAIGRVPGPAGAGDDGTMLVVLSASTAAAGQRDLFSALGEAKANALTGEHWVILLFVLAVSLGLAFYLPNMEAIGPLRRLTAEFNAMRLGSQQQLFFDTYGTGPIADLAKAAHAYHDALRATLAAGVGEDGDDGRSRRVAAVGTTRSHRKVGQRTGAVDRVDAGGGVTAQPGPAEDEAPTMAHPSVGAAGTQAGGRGPGFFTMPATKPLRSRETVIGNLMTMDNDPTAPEPAKDDAVREAYYQEVFEEFVKFKLENNEPIDNFTYEKFATKLRANTAELMKRPDVKDVQFSVYIKDGKVALKARVVRG